MEPGDCPENLLKSCTGPRVRTLGGCLACRHDQIKTVLVFHGLGSVWACLRNGSVAPLYHTEGFSQHRVFCPGIYV